MSTFESTVIKIDSATWYYIIPVPDSIYEPLLASPYKRRVKVTYDGKVTQSGALMPDGKGGYFINLNKELRKKLALVSPNQVIQVSIVSDKSEFGMEVPEVFTELLNQDEQGAACFNKLTKGKQRSLIHIIGKPKSEEIKLRKAIAILNYLVSTNGQLDYKELNEALRVKK